MYIVTYVEHIKALEGIGDENGSGIRTGKITDGVVAPFKNIESAKWWCENKAPTYHTFNSEDGIRAIWYEIWEHFLGDKCVEGENILDNLFVAAYNRFGKLINDWGSPDYKEVQESEVKHVGDRIYKEGKIEMSPESMVNIVKDAILAALEEFESKVKDKNG